VKRMQHDLDNVARPADGVTNQGVRECHCQHAEPASSISIAMPAADPRRPALAQAIPRHDPFHRVRTAWPLFFNTNDCTHYRPAWLHACW
jgi:hypothetical protein